MLNSHRQCQRTRYNSSPLNRLGRAVFLFCRLCHRAEQIENADRANAQPFVADSPATRSWKQTHLPISEHSLVALHLRTAKRWEHRVGQLSCAQRQHPRSFQACDSRAVPNRRDVRRTVAKPRRRCSNQDLVPGFLKQHLATLQSTPFVIDAQNSRFSRHGTPPMACRTST